MDTFMLTKSQRLVISLSVWIIVVLTVLVLLQSLSYEFFFILSLIGFLIIIELSGPFRIKPKWSSRVNIVLAIGVIIFAMMLFNSVMKIISGYM